jgi:hypothetical protein
MRSGAMSTKRAFLPQIAEMATLLSHLILYRLSEQDRKLDAIHDQALNTNQRVTKLEKWQSFIEGGLAVLTILVVPIVIYVVVASVGFGTSAIAL